MLKRGTSIIALLLLSCAFGSADVIKLKNGNRIVCENVREKGDKIEYEIGESTYAIAKASVDSVDKLELSSSRKARCEGAHKPVLQPPHSSEPMPMKTEFLCRQLGYKQTSAGITPPMWMERCGRILQGGTVNVRALEDVENECNAELSASAYYVAGNFDHTAQNDEGAAEYLKVAVEYSPDNAEVLQLYVDVLTNLERYSEAVPIAERAASRIGPSALVMLGRTYYFAGRRDQAVQAWRLYLSSRAGYGSVENFIAQAEEFLNRRHPRRYDPDDDPRYYRRYQPPVVK